MGPPHRVNNLVCEATLYKPSGMIDQCVAVEVTRRLHAMNWAQYWGVGDAVFDAVHFVLEDTEREDAWKLGRK